MVIALASDFQQHGAGHPLGYMHQRVFGVGAFIYAQHQPCSFLEMASSCDLVMGMVFNRTQYIWGGAGGCMSPCTDG